MALGGCWIVDAIVEHGEKRGRTLGFPTANMQLGEIVHPAHGVYAVWARVEGEDAVAAGGGQFRADAHDGVAGCAAGSGDL